MIVSSHSIVAMVQNHASLGMTEPLLPFHFRFKDGAERTATWREIVQIAGENTVCIHGCGSTCVVSPCSQSVRQQKIDAAMHALGHCKQFHYH